MENTCDTISNMSEQYNIPVINDQRHYWLIRTDSGTYFTDFTTNNYIAIGWDYLTIDKINQFNKKEIDADYLKKLISLKENKPLELPQSDVESEDEESAARKKENDTISSNRTFVTKTLKKTLIFVNTIADGDIVVIPSTNSDFVAIGCVEGDVYSEQDYFDKFIKMDIGYDLCGFVKRRRVKRYKVISKTNLDIYLQNALKPQQAIFPLDEYAAYIDRNIFDIYFKSNKLHSVIRTGQESDVSIKELKQLIDVLYEMSSANKDDVSEDIKIKLNINSPGLIEIIALGAFSFTGIMAFLSYRTAKKNKGSYSYSMPFKFGASGDFSNKDEEKIKEQTERLEILINRLENIPALNLQLPDVTMGETDTKEE